MPKDTFFNLPKKKQKKVIGAAITEFADYDPINTSISRIVALAGIAKGSFYQYFLDKQDLHLYLVDLACQEQSVFMSELLNNKSNLDFFSYVQVAIRENTQFHHQHPQLNQVVYRATFSDYPWHDEVRTRLRQTISDTWEQLVRLGMKRGDVDPSYNPKLISSILTLLTLGLRDHSPEQSQSQFLTQFEELFRILELGLRPRSEVKENKTL
ncbi:TetR/AcrR family transcriptional regulator [Hazenella coriacea]|uniref:TetR family transcriptional regulator n=1 Tax=Hazenella coriacea TaxID=1179467 RepID=A0A4R3LBN9_9BACL|nr:TetR/AcrR family transcriptional regulator [Hazenella coriacea]TCS96635.1 TetR family transcriptional regulator [Hazenella coriacea]